MTKIFASAAAIRNYLSFILTLICIAAAIVAHFVRGTDIEILLPTLLGLYLGARTVTRTSAHVVAGKGSDAKAIIESVDDR